VVVETTRPPAVGVFQNGDGLAHWIGKTGERTGDVLKALPVTVWLTQRPFIPMRHKATGRKGEKTALVISRLAESKIAQRLSMAGMRTGRTFKAGWHRLAPLASRFGRRDKTNGGLKAIPAVGRRAMATLGLKKLPRESRHLLKALPMAGWLAGRRKARKMASISMPKVDLNAMSKSLKALPIGRGRKPAHRAGRQWAMAVPALAAGAGLAYLFDPQMGKRRRSLIRDQAVGRYNDLRDFMPKATKDLGNRARGLAAETKACFSGADADDSVLVERVRAALGRATPFPRAIEITAHQGHVVLSGAILAADVERALECVGAVRGVTGIENRLNVHTEPGDVPELQGKPAPVEERSGGGGNWSPGIRLLATVDGGTVAATSMKTHGLLRLVGAVTGVALAIRGIANVKVSNLLGSEPALTAE
jgi:hypothetical protein